MNRQHFNRALAALALTAGTAAHARKQYDPGASDTEITIGAIHPYSGPASAYGTIGKAIGAYFDKVNAEGGIHGRRIRYVALDDGYNPAKTLEMARRLVEQEEALLVFNPLGTASNTAIQRYLNQQRVPQLFVSTGASKWNDPRAHPWTMGWHPDYPTEAGVYAQHILETRPRARIAVLYQNDDYGKDYLQGFEDGLGSQARSMIVARASYEVTDPTVDSQLVSLKAAGADVFFNVTTPKFAAQAIRRVAEMNWKPLHILNSVSSGIGSVLTPAGLANAVGLISATYYKDPTDPQFHASREYQDWLAWMKAYYPRGDLKDNLNVYGYNVAQTLVQVLRQCGDTLTRENVMRQAANLDFTLPMLLPGIPVKTAPDDYRPIERLRLMRFDGRTWVLFGKVYGR